MKHLSVLIFIAFGILNCYGQTNAYNIGFEGGFNLCSARGYSGIDNSYNVSTLLTPYFITYHPAYL